ncbi:MAG: hypothetical protein MZV65_25180 [Chromatiales bacterium]|nr:hypothetical protein [Chromatiales bacterium]
MAEFKTMIKAAARCRHRGDPGRGLQPHRRGRRDAARPCSFRGIDNASYYRLRPDDRRYYINYTGCGNTLNLHHPRVLQMVMDSLRYWVNEMHVDGFRFDLAVDPRPRASTATTAAGALLRRDSPGPGAVAGQAHRRALGYRRRRLPGGRFPGAAGAEWNDRFRDDVRAGSGAATTACLAQLAARPAGIQRPVRARRPAARATRQLRHQPRRLHPGRPGQLQRASTTRPTARTTATVIATTCSWNCGVEGPTDDPAIRRMRAASAPQPAGHRAAVARARRCCWPATSSAAASAATTTPTVRITRSIG